MTSELDRPDEMAQPEDQEESGIGYFMKAAASLVGAGFCAAGVALFLTLGETYLRRGKQSEAVGDCLRSLRGEQRVLQEEIHTQNVRNRAAQAGVDPDGVTRGYREQRNRPYVIEQVAARKGIPLQ